MTTPTSPPKAWPKPYLLSIYELAVNEGCCRVGEGTMTPQLANSLIMSLYRLRRRSDAQHLAFIKPEYHLVTGVYEPDRRGVLFTYSSLPDGAQLPKLTSVTDRRTSSPSPQLVEQPSMPAAGEVNLEELMTSLVAEAGSRLGKSALDD